MTLWWTNRFGLCVRFLHVDEQWYNYMVDIVIDWIDGYGGGVELSQSSLLQVFCFALRV